MYKANGLSDHAPLLVCFPNNPKPKSEFQFCGMWCNDPSFLKIIHNQGLRLCMLPQLRSHQCKVDWIKFKNECNRYFFASAKQRKLATYIYSLHDQNDELIEGFKAVANKMLQFYTKLLGRQHNGNADYRRTPHAAWRNVCNSKSKGGLGIKDFSA
ncbi:hypothetical protein Cgig2_018522 [Carnegiea gigantea]|uniref:Uncharacterized protein n=1 Tax=Carnegiea gigantea TaxID=171969 RepID=A0A9Q1GIF4_9CARY|nr:hypothetical protein Cgig2_018522 [Carnegiea gigantea]